MAELSAAARATVGKSHAAGAADVKVTTVLVGVAVLAAACVLAWAASGAEPRRLYWQHTLTEAESSSQDFREHLANAAELLVKPVFVPVVYPDRTAPGITTTMHRGFRTGSYVESDPAFTGGGPRMVPW